jgi:hypothetical protein
MANHLSISHPPKKMPALEILEIIGPADQGKSKPYLCRADDDQLYYVKGQNASSSARCREWVAGHLANAFGLPIPPFCLVKISQQLLDETPDQWKNIGTGAAFASLKQSGHQWFEFGFVDAVEDNLRKDISVFDWWVKNQDREANNTNLLWDATIASLLVIDFDSAFDPNFFPTFFLNYHLFHKDWAAVSADHVMRSDYEARLIHAKTALLDACNNLPLEWLKENRQESLNGEFTIASTKEAIDRCLNQEMLWKTE